MMRFTALLCLAAQLALLVPPARGEPAAARPFLAESAAQADSTGPSEDSWLEPGKRSYKWGILGSAVGIGVGVGIGLWVKSEADQRYDMYLRTAEPQQASELFESAQRYDRATLIGFGLAEISFVGLVYFLTRDRDRSMVPTRGEPTLRVTPDGPQVGFRVRP
ncbi:MAG TPA: hypothetical protein VFP10_09500 [Candidatus Eisenbacteria bacterium]|nr:hypothetical protein [Candidatus Eisenbacteria bacterium]